MVLEFRPPEDLVNAYLQRPSPGQEASGSIEKALAMYVQLKAQQEQKALQERQLASLDAQRKTSEFGAIAPYVPEAQIPALGQQYGINIPAGSVPPVSSTGTVPSPTAGLAGPQGPLTQAPSLIDRWNQRQRPTSKAGLANYETDLDIQRKERDLATPPNAPAPAKNVPGSVPSQRPPTGFRYTADGNLEAIPGGPAAMKLEDKQRKETGLKDAAIGNADLVMTKVDQALKGVSGWSTGWGAKLLGGMPATDARNLKRDIDTIKANLGFSTLQEMRRNSPTGGALGQIAVQELEMLQSTVASLDTEQDDKQLVRNLGEVKRHYDNWKKAAKGEDPASSATSGVATTGMENLSEEELQAIINGQ